MPGPAGQRARQFFNAKNTLERKHLGDFLRELQALQVWHGWYARLAWQRKGHSAVPVRRLAAAAASADAVPGCREAARSGCASAVASISVGLVAPDSPPRTPGCCYRARWQGPPSHPSLSSSPRRRAWERQ